MKMPGAVRVHFGGVQTSPRPPAVEERVRCERLAVAGAPCAVATLDICVVFATLCHDVCFSDGAAAAIDMVTAENEADGETERPGRPSQPAIVSCMKHRRPRGRVSHAYSAVVCCDSLLALAIPRRLSH
ncbi:unnamed protein product [Heligmosomoides polygyrus]|uniref:Uncharacterized protein n=1 Tax=Heligmosomoides polygyrus TaxID=6339 RepID=A0A183FG83_HELPZ|nr:unnamed protein product [Heligmosomoides polygyrus]